MLEIVENAYVYNGTRSTNQHFRGKGVTSGGAPAEDFPGNCRAGVFPQAILPRPELDKKLPLLRGIPLIEC